MPVHLAQWNAGALKQNIALAIRDGEDEDEIKGPADVIAIQEPWIGPENAIHCPASCKYIPIYSGHGRAMLYINKKFAPEAWQARIGHNWAAVTFRLQEGVLNIISLYNEPVSSGNRAPPFQAIANKRWEGRVVLAGDINLHYPIWDTHRRTTRGTETEELLTLVQTMNLELVTPRGMTTRMGHDQRDSTIDLIWAHPLLRAELEILPEWEGSDHLSQMVRIHTETLKRNAAPPGWSWKTMDKTTVQVEGLKIAPPGGAGSIKDLEEYIDKLLEQLQGIADASTKKKEPNSGFE
ncbi:Uu.00g087720.m01.CDS01 [Anthostomella pinea]|uniref:Uu.00g087720.m01.CDS01 n=1 Tax=Anthostomella pinea TaxID=933095 RepID=A0AAI8VNB8_9PEZI|nr:Uu.00g087720.m01.CDS01 [Anthostomella pinea]